MATTFAAPVEDTTEQEIDEVLFTWRYDPEAERVIYGKPQEQDLAD